MNPQSGLHSLAGWLACMCCTVQIVCRYKGSLPTCPFTWVLLVDGGLYVKMEEMRLFLRILLFIGFVVGAFIGLFTGLFIRFFIKVFV